VTGAIALAIVLVVAVAGISMAMQSQRTGQTGAGPRTSRIPRPPRPSSEGRRSRDRRNPSPADLPPPSSPAADKEPELKGPELLRSGEAAEARVLSVVDERTTGPVTRSRLTLEIKPDDGPAFEVTVRVTFSTPESRSRVKVGGTIPVRYDKDDHSKVVIDLPQV
jgi:hypothetical protein